MKIFNIKYVLGCLWAFSGLLIIGLTFWIQEMGYYSILYILAALIYMGTAEWASSKLL